MADSWQDVYAGRVADLGGSAVRHILSLTARTGVISFAGGLPSPDLFPVREVEEAVTQVLEEDGASALQYGPSEGHAPLKAWLREHSLGMGGRPQEPESMLITSGSQQGIDLVAKLFLDPGDLVVVEEPTYLSAVQVFRFFGARFATVPLDEEGMQVERIPEILAGRRAKFIYTIPTFQNPAGVTMSLARRRRLLEISQKLHLPVVEDDPYGELRYSGEPLPSMFSLDDSKGGRVLHLGTFSKTLAPGFRLGWIALPAALTENFLYAKQASDLNTNSFSQFVAVKLCHGLYDRHIEQIRDLYRTRRDLMLAQMDLHFPKQMRYGIPEGGLFIWATGPAGLDTNRLLAKAVDQGVAFVPGATFHANGGGESTLRLNFSHASNEQIVTGISRLGAVLAEAVAALPGSA